MIKQTINHITKDISLKKALLFCGVTAFIFLIVINSKDVIFGTKLSVKSVPDGTTVSNSFFALSGSARHAQELRINGREVAFDRNGTFSDGVLLSPGYNIIDVTLKDRFGKVATKKYHVVLEQPPTVATASEPIIHNN